MLKHAATDEEIALCFPVMVELRGHLQQASFVERIRLQESEGYRLAYIENAAEIVAVAGYRISTNLFMGKNLYVDDLVTASRVRSKGFGKAILAELVAVARRNDCEVFHLDSGTQRTQAHKFYFREGLAVASFHFSQALD